MKRLIIFLVLLVVVITSIFIIQQISESNRLTEEEVKENLSTQIPTKETMEIEEIVLPEHCRDGIYNEGEEGLDCGWTCSNECDFIEKVGDLTVDETWGGNILVADPGVTAPKGITLTIEPGSVVKFKACQNNYKGLCEAAGIGTDGGKIIAIGTPDKPIWFTSAAKEPMNGDWAGLYVFKDGEAIIDYAIIEFGPINVHVYDSKINLTNSIIRWGNDEGIYMERSSGLIENNTIYGNAFNGLAMEQFNHDVIVRRNKFIDGHGAVHAMESHAIVENNFIANNSVGISATTSSNVRYRGNIVKDNKWAGYANTYATTEYLNNDISNNEQGMSISETSNVKMNYNKICNNEFNIGFGEIPPKESTDITNNWWCTTDKNEIKKSIVAGYGEVDINFEPVLEKDPVKVTVPEFDYEDLKNFEIDYIPMDPEDRYLYEYPDDETRRIVKRFKWYWSFQLEWADGYLWRGTGPWPGKIFRVDPETGEEVTIIPAPEIQRLAGLAYDGKHLWAGCFVNKKVYKIDPESGEIISSYDLPDEMENGISGMVWDGEYLYLVEWLGSGLYKVDEQGNLLEVLPVPFGGRGITWDGEHFWTGGGVGCPPGICKFTKKGEIAGWIYNPAIGTAGLAWEPADNEYGGYLWALAETPNSNNNTFKIEILNDSIGKHERCQLRSILFNCTRYNLSNDKISIQVENKGTKGITINSVSFYWVEPTNMERDCAKRNLNLRIEPKGKVDIEVYCDILKDYLGVQLNLGLFLEGILDDGTWRSIDGHIITKIDSSS